MKIVQHYKEYPWILVSSRAGTKRQLYFKVLLMSCLHNETVCSHSKPCLSLLSVSQLFFWAHNQLQVPRIHCCSVTKSCPTLCDPMDRTQHTHLPCPSPSPGVCSNSCLLSQWCHSTILLSVIPFFYLQPFPASGSFLMSELFPSGGQSIGASASASVLPINIQNWFPLGLSGWISFQSKGLSRVFSNTTADLDDGIWADAIMG